MELQLLELYSSLPLPSPKLLYIPGYTEALTGVTGIRIIPTYDFTAMLPGIYRRFFDTMTYPCYYIPVKIGSAHYGFILKGIDKMTSRYSSYYPFFNMDSLLSDKPYVFLVEGIKDAGIFIERGEPVISILTSGISPEHAALFRQFNKCPIIIPDNDGAGKKGARRLVNRDNSLGISVFYVHVHGHKDMGNYYDSPNLRSFVEQTYSSAVSIARSIPDNTNFLSGGSRGRHSQY